MTPASILLAESTVDAAAKLIESGVLGAIIVGLFSALAKVWYDAKTAAKECETNMAAVVKRYEDERAAVALRHETSLKTIHDQHGTSLAAIHGQRIADYEKMTATLLRTTEQSVACLTTVANGQEAIRDALLRPSR